ncbi:hypothetical protein A2U01_0088847, partial [Trifolium medium]|nr:hypothetical protein [Trifolium medium]
MSNMSSQFRETLPHGPTVVPMSGWGSNKYVAKDRRREEIHTRGNIEIYQV